LYLVGFRYIGQVGVSGGSSSSSDLKVNYFLPKANGQYLNPYGIQYLSKSTSYKVEAAAILKKISCFAESGLARQIVILKNGSTILTSVNLNSVSVTNISLQANDTIQAFVPNEGTGPLRNVEVNFSILYY